MRTVYLVNHNMAGYMPESDSYYTRTKRAAISMAYQDARRDCDDLNEGDSERFTLHGKDGDYWVECVKGRTGLSYHYWYAELSAELVRDIPAALYHPRCADCERRLDEEPDSVYHVENDDYLCRDCI